MNIVEVNCETGVTVAREATAEEVAAMEDQKIADEATIARLEAIQEQRDQDIETLKQGPTAPGWSDAFLRLNGLA